MDSSVGGFSPEELTAKTYLSQVMGDLKGDGVLDAGSGKVKMSLDGATVEHWSNRLQFTAAVLEDAGLTAQAKEVLDIVEQLNAKLQQVEPDSPHIQTVTDTSKAYFASFLDKGGEAWQAHTNDQLTAQDAEQFLGAVRQSSIHQALDQKPVGPKQESMTKSSHGRPGIKQQLALLTGLHKSPESRDEDGQDFHDSMDEFFGKVADRLGDEADQVRASLVDSWLELEETIDAQLSQQGDTRVREDAADNAVDDAYLKFAEAMNHDTVKEVAQEWSSRDYPELTTFVRRATMATRHADR